MDNTEDNRNYKSLTAQQKRLLDSEQARQLHAINQKQSSSNQRFNERYYDRDNPIADIAEHWEGTKRVCSDIDPVIAVIDEAGIKGKDKTLLVMRFEGYTQAEIGDKLGWTQQYVSKRLKELQHRMTQEYER